MSLWNKWIDAYFGSYRLTSNIIREVFLDGFETYDDYVKYGDMFIPCDYTPTIYTPIERQLNP
jgi:hypothetical protein